MFIRTERSIKEFMQYYPVVSTLIIIHLSLWLLIDFLQLPLASLLYQWGAGSNFYILNEGEYWRLITPIFLHGGLMHTLFNSFALVLFGPALEQMLGKVKFIAAYLGAGLAGNIATLLLGPSSFYYVHVGASGAIFGLFGIYIYMTLLRKDLIDQSSSQVVMTISIIGLVMTFLRPGINIYAHIFGFIGGLLLAPIVLNKAQPFSVWRNRPVRRNDDTIQFDPNRWRKKRFSPKLKKNLFWIILGILVLLGLLGRLNIW
ncbi:rhomboid family intramembrane serine protease [Oceanobacillus halotolerans]|uniref:rhomboid family intramembrane serine protease n=1 Tax=Oceanobacillus halotolerans TaxID=2663380 RepID=UPI0013DCD9E2|nr:rhomboid family intramembrane serine protease [Oceanobacillus halotolerans]